MVVDDGLTPFDQRFFSETVLHEVGYLTDKLDVVFGVAFVVVYAIYAGVCVDSSIASGVRHILARQCAYPLLLNPLVDDVDGCYVPILCGRSFARLGYADEIGAGVIVESFCIPFLIAGRAVTVHLTGTFTSRRAANPELI